MDNSKQFKKNKKALHAILSQQNRWLMLVGSGTSIAMDRGLGMEDLAKHLLGNISDDSTSWQEIITNLEKGENLEVALTDVRPPSELQEKIATETYKFVSKQEYKSRDKILTGKQKWTAIRLIESFYHSLNSTSATLPVTHAKLRHAH